MRQIHILFVRNSSYYNPNLHLILLSSITLNTLLSLPFCRRSSLFADCFSQITLRRSPVVVTQTIIVFVFVHLPSYLPLRSSAFTHLPLYLPLHNLPRICLCTICPISPFARLHVCTFARLYLV